MADSGSYGYGVLDSRSGRGSRPAGRAVGVSFLPVTSPGATLSRGHEDDEQTRELDLPRRGIAVAVIVIVACLIVLGLTSGFLVDLPARSRKA